MYRITAHMLNGGAPMAEAKTTYDAVFPVTALNDAVAPLAPPPAVNDVHPTTVAFVRPDGPESGHFWGEEVALNVDARYHWVTPKLEGKLVTLYDGKHPHGTVHAASSNTNRRSRCSGGGLRRRAFLLTADTQLLLACRKQHGFCVTGAATVRPGVPTRRVI
jgi:hypothetical protein